ncbi:conserved exported protein of unknown function [Rhodovastum atsumiense]|uniref:Acid-shock protein n=1 Tax=Rhodovastum atsumiense TaxID=504468 RepID=A0A5M6J0J2_9PROT|nr:hypothetical protein [Rhodovastum atsumiense]KAA5613607.1 hypothetical protein F1189_04110 [Rhodovastum atsumiense]CAH2599509.1 conserved exported protein of unknown function [Rhodovastum atsumiense]
MRLGTLSLASILFLGLSLPGFAASPAAGTLMAQAAAPTQDLGSSAAPAAGAQDTQAAPAKKKAHKSKATRTKAKSHKTTPAPVQH